MSRGRNDARPLRCPRLRAARGLRRHDHLRPDGAPAEGARVRVQPVLRGRPRHAPAAAGHGPAGAHRAEPRAHPRPRRRQGRHGDAPPAHARPARPRAPQVRHLLRHLPRAGRRRPQPRGGEHVAAAAAQPPRPDGDGGGPLLPGDRQRVRPDAGVRGRAERGGALGGDRLPARAAAQPGRAPVDGAPAGAREAVEGEAAMNEQPLSIDELPRWQGGRTALIGCTLAGAAGLALTAVGYLFDARRTMLSYLVAFLYFLGLTLGMLALNMAKYAARARWHIVIRRAIEAVHAPLPALAVLFVPIALAARQIYAWIDPPSWLDKEVLHNIEHKHGYLNLSGFLWRAAIYFAVWLLISELLYRNSIAQDEDGSPRRTASNRRWGSVGLPLVAIAATFAAFDWLMSLNPTWYSTLFGVYFLTGSFVAALALLVLILTFAREPGSFGALVAKALSVVAAWLLFVHLADLVWLVFPSAQMRDFGMKWSPAGLGLHWTLITSFAGVGGVWAAFAIWRMRGKYPVPIGDPYLEDSLRYLQP